VLRTQELVAGIQAHQVWLVYLLELWESARHRVRRADAPLASALRRLLAAALASPEALCSHPYARPALFRLLSLGLRFCRHLRVHRVAVGAPSLRVRARARRRV